MRKRSSARRHVRQSLWDCFRYHYGWFTIRVNGTGEIRRSVFTSVVLQNRSAYGTLGQSQAQVRVESAPGESVPEGRRTVVAVLNASTDVLELLREALVDEGFAVVTAKVPEIKRGQEDLIAFLHEHD